MRLPGTLLGLVLAGLLLPPSAVSATTADLTLTCQGRVLGAVEIRDARTDAFIGALGCNGASARTAITTAEVAWGDPEDIDWRVVVTGKLGRERTTEAFSVRALPARLELVIGDPNEKVIVAWGDPEI